jgi:sRNA-binding protein
MEPPAAPCAGAQEGDGNSGGWLDGQPLHIPPSENTQENTNRLGHLLELLKAVAPVVFRIPPVPLAVGIRRQVLDLAGDEYTWNEVAAVLRRWTGRYDYVVAIAAGGQRFNIDGTPAGEVMPEHQQFARAQLAACAPHQNPK